MLSKKSKWTPKKLIRPLLADVNKEGSKLVQAILNNPKLYRQNGNLTREASLKITSIINSPRYNAKRRCLQFLNRNAVLIKIIEVASFSSLLILLLWILLNK